MKILFLATITTMVFILASCSFVYIPSAPFVFNHENEGDLSIDFRQGGFSSNLNVGYAVTDNFNLGTSLSSLYTNEVFVGSTSYEGSQAYDLHIIGGYYTKLSDNTLFEMNAGAGSIITNSEVLLNYTKFYVQPTIGFQSQNKNTVFNIGVRALGTSVNFVDSQVDTFYYNGYVEPFLSLSAGKKVHFLMQTGVSLPVLYEPYGDVSPFLFNIGIGYSIGTMQKEKAELLKDID